MKALRKMTTGIAKGALAATLLHNVGESGHGGIWDLSYFDRKFQMILATFEVINQEITQIGEIMEIMESQFQQKHTNDIIMKSVLFVSTAALIAGLIWLATKMKGNVYLKGMQSLVSSLAGLKSDYKAKIHILKTQQDVQEAHARHQETEENFSLMQSRDAGATFEDI